METSLPLDFGATPVNESKVGTWLYLFLKNVCLLPDRRKKFILGPVCFRSRRSR